MSNVFIGQYRRIHFNLDHVNGWGISVSRYPLRTDKCKDRPTVGISAMTTLRREFANLGYKIRAGTVSVSY